MIAVSLLLPVLVSLAAADEASRLAAGEIVIKKSGKDAVTVVAVIDAPPDKVWAVVSDCANYKKTMPSIADSERLSFDGKVMICKVTADVPFPFSDLVSVTRAELTVGPPKWIRRWVLVSGDYTRNEGSWQLEPYGTDGRRTLATYNILAKPKIALPEALIERAQQSKLPDVMRNLRQMFPARP